MVFHLEQCGPLFLKSHVTLGFSGCGQALTTCKKVFYKVVVSEAFCVTIKQMNPFAGGHSPIMFSCYSIVMVLSDA